MGLFYIVAWNKVANKADPEECHPWSDATYHASDLGAANGVEDNPSIKLDFAGAWKRCVNLCSQPQLLRLLSFPSATQRFDCTRACNKLVPGARRHLRTGLLFISAAA